LIFLALTDIISRWQKEDHKEMKLLVN
jgi:hypothetical protein